MQQGSVILKKRTSRCYKSKRKSVQIRRKLENRYRKTLPNLQNNWKATIKNFKKLMRLKLRQSHNQEVGEPE